MRSIKWIRRGLWLSTAAVLPQFGGCLSDQQLTSILESAISTGLNVLVSSAIQAVFGATTV